MNKRFKQLLEAQLGNVKPLVEQVQSSGSTITTGATVNDYIKSQTVSNTPALRFMTGYITKIGGQSKKVGDYMVFTTPNKKLFFGTKDGKTFTAYNSDRTTLSNGQASMTIVYDNDNNFYKTISDIMEKN